jgi:hypothetical protein
LPSPPLQYLNNHFIITTKTITWACMAHLITSPQDLPSPEATALFDSISMPCHRLPDPIVAFSGLYPAHLRCMRLESTKSKRFFSAYFRCNSPLLSESCQMQVSAPSRQPPMSTPMRHLLRAEGQFSSARDIIIITTSTWQFKRTLLHKRQAPSATRTREEM